LEHFVVFNLIIRSEERPIRHIIVCWDTFMQSSPNVTLCLFNLTPRGILPVYFFV